MVGAPCRLRAPRLVRLALWLQRLLQLLLQLLELLLLLLLEGAFVRVDWYRGERANETNGWTAGKEGIERDRESTSKCTKGKTQY